MMRIRFIVLVWGQVRKKNDIIEIIINAKAHGDLISCVRCLNYYWGIAKQEGNSGDAQWKSLKDLAP